jgi:predicted ATPase
MRETWLSVGGGRPCWVLVGGEAGIGKTRLITEFAGEVTAAGARVMVGNCPPVAPGLVPFAPVAEVLRELGDQVAEGLAPGPAEAITVFWRLSSRRVLPGCRGRLSGPGC